MSQHERPKAIHTFLETLSATKSLDASALFEYVTILEAQQPKRPEQIDDILKKIAKQHPRAIVDDLMNYLTGLEAAQQPHQADNDNTSFSPKWSHQRQAQRTQHRRERASRKYTDYGG